MAEEQTSLHLPNDALKAACVGLLIVEGHTYADAWRIVDDPRGLPEFAAVLRKVASVALTLQQFGLLKVESVH